MLTITFLIIAIYLLFNNNKSVNTLKAAPDEKSNENEFITLLSIRKEDDLIDIENKPVFLNTYDVALRTLERLRFLLQKERSSGRQVDLVVFPESAFEITYFDDKLGKQIPTRIVKVIHSEDHFEGIEGYKQALDLIEIAQKIAREYKTSIMLGTFTENPEAFDIPPGTTPDMTFPNRRPENLPDTLTINDKAIMFYINSEGKIIGIKRKFEPPQGDFSLKLSGKFFKILPIICTDGCFSPSLKKLNVNFPTPYPNQTPICNPEKWMVNYASQNGQYDIVADLIKKGLPRENYTDLAYHIQNNFRDLKTSNDFIGYLIDKEFFEKAFNNYKDVILPEAPIILADWGFTGILKYNLSKFPIENYSEIKDDKGEKIGTVVKIPLPSLSTSTPYPTYPITFQ